ncbi:molybdopterin molybdotransferase MoeA [Halostagnicola kamekurae]|uniref:Molybdopterin molybdochelatase n=1 Tax=Halostagnicola kamekurae TaxID=619731 RepID=A0A1I6PXH1_9EURY|nr:molybdopterin molybdotransferase MoeA [Halostagnicola kamekurae]SFS44906.1 molybdopterin molybdochelatase [Halostagnicola kamekurae]
MKGADHERTEAGFKVRTPLEEARTALRDALAVDEREPRTERLPIEQATGRAIAESVTASRDVPHYRRAAMDGYAVVASDTFGASDRSPAVLRVADADDSIASGTAVRVHTGSALPEGSDAVVMIERVETIDGTNELEVLEAVAEGENVAPVGDDVESGQPLYEPGHRLRPSDLGLLKSVGRSRVSVAREPRVGVVPTGEELVQRDPEPGEVVETNGLTVSRLVDGWGGRSTYRNVVTDDRDALRVAIERDLTKDAIVTTGGSSVGERDLLPEVIDDIGEVVVHGVGLEPGHPVCLGIVEDTPVLALPGYPVACIVTAVQFLRPVLRWLEGTEPEPHLTTMARLTRKIPSEPATRTFARVALEPRATGGDGSPADEDGTGLDDTDSNGADPDSAADGPVVDAVPTRASGAGVLSSVALADGWVVVDDDREGIPAGETVAVQRWE